MTDAAAAPDPARISVCIICRNEADKLADCLASVTWADEILVMDLESTDGSGELATGRGAKVVRRPPHPVVEPLRDELAQHATGEWVLALDPDERIRPGLADALRDAALRPELDAVVIPRMNIDFGWPAETPGQRYEPQLRMYRRSAVSWPHFPNRLPSVPQERTLRLAGRDELVMEHLRNRSVAETTERLVRYPTAQAQAMLDAGETFSAEQMLKTLGGKARRYYIDNRAWEEGVPGLVRATVLLNHHVYVWMAFWHLSGGARTAEDDAVVRRAGRVLRGLDAATRVAGKPRGLARRLARSRSQSPS